MRNPHKGGDVGRPDLWRIRHKRLVTVAEVPPDVKLDVALFKSMLSGSDKMAIRTFYDAKGGEDVTWAVTLWMSGNKPYGPPPGEAAAYERLFPLKCDHVMPVERRDDAKQVQTLDMAITGSAVLNLLLEGFQQVYGVDAGQLKPPSVVLEARSELRVQLDDFTDIFAEVFEITQDPHDGVKKSEAAERVCTVLEWGGEKISRRGSFKKKIEEALEWRVGKPAHSSARWGGCDYWPGVKWPEERLADNVKYLQRQRDRGVSERTLEPMVSLPDWS